MNFGQNRRLITKEVNSAVCSYSGTSSDGSNKNKNRKKHLSQKIPQIYPHGQEQAAEGISDG